MSPRILASAIALLLVGAATDSSAFKLKGGVVGNGGTKTAGGGRVILGTVGQPLLGRSTGTAYVVNSGFWAYGGTRTVEAGPAPLLLSLGVAMPNPFSDTVSFRLDLPRAAGVRLSIFDVRGRCVLARQSWLSEGPQRIAWDGRDRSSRLAPGGIYFARVAVDGVAAGERRIVLER